MIIELHGDASGSDSPSYRIVQSSQRGSGHDTTTRNLSQGQFFVTEALLADDIPINPEDICVIETNRQIN